MLTAFALWELEKEHARAMYGWRHPENIKWAKARREKREVDELAELRRRVDELQAVNRRRGADEPEQPDVVDDRHDEQACEPLVISWRGGRRHAK